MGTKYLCLVCPTKQEFDSRDDMRKHLVLIHGYVPGTLGERKQTIFLDGSGGYHRQEWEWDFGNGLKIQEVWESHALGEKPQVCYVCGDPAPFLCDWPDKSHKSGTCDRPVCGKHRVKPVPTFGKPETADLDYCMEHGALYNEQRGTVTHANAN